MRDVDRPAAMVLEILGWLGLALATTVGAFIVKGAAGAYSEIERLEGVHGGGEDLVIVGALVLLAGVGVVWLGALAMVIGGRHWRRPRPDPTVPPSWWYPPS